MEKRAGFCMNSFDIAVYLGLIIAVVTGFNITTAHGYFLVNGAIAGLVLFVWAMLAVWLAPFFRKPSPSA